MNFSQ